MYVCMYVYIYIYVYNMISLLAKEWSKLMETSAGTCSEEGDETWL